MLLLVRVVLALAAAPARADEPVPACDDTPLPLDPGVATGRLANGLRWWTERGKTPEQRAELRLVVDAGSVLEDDDQRGAAHFLEHMAFEGSDHFAEGELVRWFESVGIAFGAHANAVTSFDSTVYRITVPTDDPAVLDRALDVLADQAHALTLAPDAFERERRVVLEEWRSRLGAGERLFEQLLPYQFAGSRYPSRVPIGTEESIRSMTLEQVRRFYQDWYRPDLMAVLAVGDFDVGEMQRRIEAKFGGFENPASPRPRLRPEIPPQPERAIAVVADPEAQLSAVSLVSSRREPFSPTCAGYRDRLAGSLVRSVLAERLDDRANLTGSPLSHADAQAARQTPLQVFDAVGAQARVGRELESLVILATEVERLRRYGVTQEELDRAAARALSAAQQRYAERDHESSSSAIAELVRAFLYGESVPGVEAELDLTRRLLPGLTPTALSDLTASWMKGENQLAEVIAAPSPDGAVPSPTEVASALDSVSASEISAPAGSDLDRPLVEAPPVGGRVKRRGELPELGITTWKLSNGVVVWLMPTEFVADDIRLEAWSPGGRSQVPDAEWFSASAAESLRSRSGLGSFRRPDLDKRLAGVPASVSVDLNRYDEQIHGQATPETLETMLQLVYLEFTAPRFDRPSLDKYLESKSESIRLRARDPDAIFEDAWNNLVWQGALRYRPWTERDLGAINLPDAARFWRDRMANAADFRFFLVGNLDLRAVEPLVAKYLGGLPASKRRDRQIDDGSRPITGVHDLDLQAGTEPKARVRITWSGPAVDTWLTRARLDALEDIFEVRLREELRETLGGVYGASVGSDIWSFPTGGYRVDVNFRCDPARVEELEAAVDRVVVALRTEPVDESYVASEREKVRRAKELSVRSNSYWATALRGTWSRREDPRELLLWPLRNDSLTPYGVLRAAQEWLAPANVVREVMRPQAP